MNKFHRANHGLIHPREGTWAVWQMEAARFQGFTLCFSITDCMFTLGSEPLITSYMSSFHQPLPKHINQIFASQGKAIVAKARLAGADWALLELPPHYLPPGSTLLQPPLPCQQCQPPPPASRTTPTNYNLQQHGAVHCWYSTPAFCRPAFAAQGLPQASWHFWSYGFPNLLDKHTIDGFFVVKPCSSDKYFDLFILASGRTLALATSPADCCQV